jgi:hypothetical protein
MLYFIENTSLIISVCSVTKKARNVSASELFDVIFNIVKFKINIVGFILWGKKTIHEEVMHKMKTLQLST